MRMAVDQYTHKYSEQQYDVNQLYFLLCNTTKAHPGCRAV